MISIDKIISDTWLSFWVAGGRRWWGGASRLCFMRGLKIITSSRAPSLWTSPGARKERRENLALRVNAKGAGEWEWLWKFERRTWSRWARENVKGAHEREGRAWTRRERHGRVKGRTLSFFLQINTFREPNHLNALEGTPILLFAQDRICPSFQFATTENIKTINTNSDCTQGLKEWIFRPGFNRIRQERQKEKKNNALVFVIKFTVQKLFRTKTIRTDNVSPFDRGKFKCLNVVG